MMPKTRVRRLADRVIAEIVERHGRAAKPSRKHFSQVTPAEADAALDRRRGEVEAGAVAPVEVSDALRAVLAKQRGGL